MEKKKGLSILMGGLLLLMCFFSFAALQPKKAAAAHPDYMGQNCIYYYCDLYPSLDADALARANVSEPSLLIDRKAISDQEFTSLVSSGYFSTISDCIVVMDFKRFIPSALSTVLYNLKQLQDCTVILVTAEYLDFSISSTYVDGHCESDLQRFEAFISNSKRAILDYSGNEANIQVLLDGSFIDAEDENIGYLEGLMENNPFAKILLEEFGPPFCYEDINVTPSVRFLLHTGGSSYIDLINGNTATLHPDRETFALGCWALDGGFYNHLYSLQSNSDICEIYVMEGSPITYSNPGLLCIDEWELAARYGYEGDESDDVLDLLAPYIY